MTTLYSIQVWSIAENSTEFWAAFSFVYYNLDLPSSLFKCQTANAVSSKHFSFLIFYSSIILACLRKCAGLLETALEGAVLDELLQVRVSADVLLGEEDVGDGALAGDFEEGVLEIVTVVCE